MDSVGGGSEGRPPLATLLAPPPSRPSFLLFCEPLNTGAGNSWRRHWAQGPRESAPLLPRPPTADITRGRDGAPPLRPRRPARVLQFCRAAGLGPLGARSSAPRCGETLVVLLSPSTACHLTPVLHSCLPFSVCERTDGCVSPQCRAFERQIRRRPLLPNPLSFLPLT